MRKKRRVSDITVLKRINAALQHSSSPQMLRANLEYFWRRYIVDSDAARNTLSVFRRASR